MRRPMAAQATNIEDVKELSGSQFSKGSLHFVCRHE